MCVYKTMILKQRQTSKSETIKMNYIMASSHTIIPRCNSIIHISLPPNIMLSSCDFPLSFHFLFPTSSWCLLVYEYTVQSILISRHQPFCPHILPTFSYLGLFAVVLKLNSCSKNSPSQTHVLLGATNRV